MTTETKTLRDEFAIAALSSLITMAILKTAQCTYDEIAKDAYRYADKMLKAREAE